MRLRTVIAVLGYILIASAACGLVLTVLKAIRDNQAFYGRNVYGLAIGTYSTAAMLVIVAAVGLVWLVQKFRRR